MAAKNSGRSCFGFFVGDAPCLRCSAAPNCKAILVSHGFDVAAGLLEEVIETLPEDAVFDIDPDALFADEEASADDAAKALARGAAKSVYTQIISPGAVPVTAGVDEVSDVTADTL